LIDVRQTHVFAAWLSGLRDNRARTIIVKRIQRVAQGNYGDAKFFAGIGELRIDYGPGYRVYFVRRGPVVVILMSGGDKSTQDADIRDAIAMAQEV
jgi:putative addiction module killer protein